MYLPGVLVLWQGGTEYEEDPEPVPLFRYTVFFLETTVLLLDFPLPNLCSQFLLLKSCIIQDQMAELHSVSVRGIWTLETLG